MKKQGYFIVSIILILGSLTACDDMGILEPEDDNVYDM